MKWLTTFFRRFFTQQFKRSCLPDGPKVGYGRRFRRAATSACRATRPPKYGCGKSKRSKRSNANAADRANLSAASYLLKQFYRNKQYGTA